MFRVSELDEETDGPKESRRRQLQDKLREVDERFRREMRARGFDPEQGENLALTAPLARLYTERENVRGELDALTERRSSK